MRRILVVASCVVLAFSTVAKADIVEDFWTKVLSTENPDTQTNYKYGDSIRVILATSGQYTATHNDRGYYDGVGDSQALKGLITGTFESSPGVALTAAEWEPLVASYDQKDTNPVASWIGTSNTVGVFNTNGDFLGTESAIVTTGLAGSAGLGVVYDQSGDLVASVNNGVASLAVWTGTDRSGNDYVNTTPTPDIYFTTSVGGQAQDGGGTAIGSAGSASGWLSSAITVRGVDVLDEFGTIVGHTDFTRSIYVMSDDVMVVPEPTSILMWLGFSGVAGLVFWRRRRSS